MEKKVIKVKSKDNLVTYLNKNENISQNVIFKMLRKKDIKVNGIKQNKNIVVFENDVIEYYIKFPKLNIIFENDDFLVIDKQYNIEVTGDNSIESILNKKDSKIKYIPVHRLDRNTTRLVLFAKSQEYANYLISLFKNKQITKKYIAITIGKTNFKDFSKPLYLFNDKKKNISIVKDKKDTGFTQIKQNISTIENFNINGIDLSLVKIEIETGKTHQIRSCLKYLGYPILGDGKYGDNRINTKFGLSYQLLNSNEISFDNFSFKSNFDLKKYISQKIH